MTKYNKLTYSVATQRIEKLMHLAESAVESKSEGNERLARRYVELALKIGSHYKVKIPKALKMKICHKCMLPLMPGLTCTVRHSSMVTIYKCECGEQNKIMLKGSLGAHLLKK